MSWKMCLGLQYRHTCYDQNLGVGYKTKIKKLWRVKMFVVLRMRFEGTLDPWVWLVLGLLLGLLLFDCWGGLDSA